MLARMLGLYKDAYRGLSPSTWWLSLVMLVNRSGTMVVPFMTIYLTSPEMNYSIGKAGIVMGLFGLGAVAGGYLGGKLTDKSGFYIVQVITLAGGGLLFMVLGQLKTFPLICIFTFLLSLVNEAFRPANATAIAFYSTENNRTRSYSLNRLAINLGWAVGGAIGGLLASISYELLFWVDGFTNITAAILLWVFLKPSREHKPVKPLASQSHIPLSHSAYKDKLYLWFILLTILFATCFFQIFSTLTAYFKNELHFSSSFIGMLMALNGLIITFIEMVLVYKLEGKRKNTYYITMGVLLCSLAYLMLNLFPINHTAAILMIVVITLGEIMSMPFMNSFWIARSSINNRGQYAGLFTIAWSVAHTTGPLAGSQLAEHSGFSALWWAVGGLCFITSVGFFVLHKNN
jgi:predicted MFS family arabinose efflux permease